MSLKTQEKAKLADRMEHREIIKFCVDLGKNLIETKQMLEETVKHRTIFRNHLSTSDFLMKCATVPLWPDGDCDIVLLLINTISDLYSLLYSAQGIISFILFL